MRPFFLVLYCLLTLAAKAKSIYNQNASIVIRYEKTLQGDYNFLCENTAFCPYTITVDFPELMNMRSDIMLPAVIEVRPGLHRILTLKKTSTVFSFRYTYSYAKGGLRARVDTGIAYLLPIAPGKETRVFNLSWIATQYSGEREPKDFYAIAFRMHSGDTVYSSRRGLVTETYSNTVFTNSGIAYQRQVNYVEVLHDDGTFGRYDLLRANSIFVRPGELVEAGQPLGIAGGENYLNGVQIQFYVRYHLEQKILDRDHQPTGQTEYWAYVPTNFWARGIGRTHLDSQTTYTSEYPADIIVREMSKKEARKWRETHPDATIVNR